MVFIPLLSQIFTYKLFPLLRCVLNHNGALRTDLISSDFTPLQKSIQLIRTSFQKRFLIFIAKLLEYSPPKKTKKLFVAFPWVETSTGPGGFMICMFII